MTGQAERAPLSRPGTLTLVCIIIALEAVGLVLAAGTMLYVSLASGVAGSLSSMIALAVLLLVFAFGLFTAARGLWLGQRWPRGLVVAWSLLVFIVAVSLVAMGESVGWMVAALCAIVVLVMFSTPVMMFTDGTHKVERKN